MATRVRWRGLELPSRVSPDPKFRSEKFGRFVIEPFEKGFGTTLGNSLRRVLLSSLEGSAVTSVKIKGASHEFTSLPGVTEDVTDIILNVKGLVVQMDSDEPKKLTLAATGPGDVTADLIEGDPSIAVFNTEQLICTLTDKVDFEMELNVAKGRGYVPASEQYRRDEDQEIGIIPIDAIYSPVQRVRYKVEETRVGQRTNYDKLIMDIWTNGTLTPEMALVEASKILRKHLNPFVQYFEIGQELVSEEAAAAAGVDEELIRKLKMPVSEMDLSVRANNCLESARVVIVADLVSKTDAELLKVRSFGRTSLREVKRKLEDMHLSLGMTLPEGVQVTGGSGGGGAAPTVNAPAVPPGM